MSNLSINCTEYRKKCFEREDDKSCSYPAAKLTEIRVITCQFIAANVVRSLDMAAQQLVYNWFSDDHPVEPNYRVLEYVHYANVKLTFQ